MRSTQRNVLTNLRINVISEAERRQVEIKSSMRKYCLKHKVQEKPSTNFESWRYFFVDDEFQILYCAIAKVGSTTLKRMLAKLHNKTFPDNYPYVSNTKNYKQETSTRKDLGTGVGRKK